MALGSQIAQIVLPKKKANPNGTSLTSTYQASNNTQILSLPDYRNHTQDIFTNRQSQDARDLIKDLVKYDPDVSATLHAYMTVADTLPRFYVYDQNDVLDHTGQQQLEALLGNFARRNDYSTGFSFTDSLRQVAEDFRYMILLRGQVSAELVFNKFLLPSEIRHVDPATLQWFETQPGLYKPQQLPPGSSTLIPLDIPNFFVKSYRQNPGEIYPESLFVSAINTIAARQQVINDLYRIMQKTGYPRIEVTVIEEVLKKSAPADARKSDAAMSSWVNTQISSITGAVAGMRPDTVFVHTDSVKPSIMNQGGPSKSMDVESIIGVLNSQNQSALKTVATFIGRGESGVNTASVEARVFSMAADSLNGPVADMFSEMFTLAMRLTGYQGYVTCEFDKSELRPSTELEPMLVIRQARYLEMLSLGLITDDEFHSELFGRPAPDAAPVLSGTGFMQPQLPGVDVSTITPNADPLGKSLAPSGGKVSKSDAVKTAPAAKKPAAKPTTTKARLNLSFNL